MGWAKPLGHYYSHGVYQLSGLEMDKGGRKCRRNRDVDCPRAEIASRPALGEDYYSWISRSNASNDEPYPLGTLGAIFRSYVRGNEYLAAIRRNPTEEGGQP